MSKGYFENFIKKIFKLFLDNKHRIQERVITVTKKPLFLALTHSVIWTITIVEPSSENRSRVFSVLANYRLYLRVKSN